MKFGDKLKELRKSKKISQQTLAKMIGVSYRTIQNYETADRYPKQRDVYAKLAEALECDVNYLLTEDEEFITEAQEQYGCKGAKDAQELISKVSGLFAGGEVTEETKDEVMQAIQQAYWEAKKANQKYTPKKYRRETD